MGAIKPKEGRKAARIGPQRLSLTLGGAALGGGKDNARATPALSGPNSSTPLPGIFTARLVALDERGQAWIEWDADDAPPERADLAKESQGGPETRIARSTLPLAREHIGRELLVCREPAGRARDRRCSYRSRGRATRG
jgi:hypothetical protein